MSNEYKICIPFFLRITADQCLFLWFQVKWVLDLSVILLGYQSFDLVESYCRNIICLRHFNVQNLKFSCILLFQKFYCILKESCLHCHDIFKSINISHLEIKACVLIQMTLCVVFLCTEYWRCLKDSVEYSDHHLLIELWALLKDRRSVEILQTEKVRTALCTLGADFRSMDLCKSFFIKEITEPSYDSFLNSELRTLSDISQRNRSVV